MNKLLYVVCPNGYGHIKRSLTIIEALLREKNNLNVTWLISASNASYFEANASDKCKKRSDKIVYSDDIGCTLKNMRLTSFVERFHDWTSTLEKTLLKNSFDLVLSDNFSGPLHFCDNVILVGSFLWHNVLERTESNKDFLDFERTALESKKPKMLHILNMGMPGVLQQTEGIPIPWVTTQYPHFKPVESEEVRILITAGKSGVDRELFVEISNELLKESSFKLYGNKKMLEEVNDLKFKEFDFSENSFSKLSLIICRPGIGIITDAIKYQIPLLTHSRFSNNELVFNANKIQELGIGEQVDFFNKKKVEEIVSELANPSNKRTKILNEIKRQPMGGADFAAKLILEYNNND